MPHSGANDLPNAARSIRAHLMAIDAAREFPWVCATLTTMRWRQLRCFPWERIKERRKPLQLLSSNCYETCLWGRYRFCRRGGDRGFL